MLRTPGFGDFSLFFEDFYGFLVFEHREMAGKRSQMISGCVRDACDALARVSEFSER